MSRRRGSALTSMPWNAAYVAVPLPRSRRAQHQSPQLRVELAKALDQPLGAFVDHVLDPKKPKPKGSPAEAVDQWEELERFVESRLRPE